VRFSADGADGAAMSAVSARPHYDGVWVADRYWHEPEDYVDHCFDDGEEPESSVEICRARPFEMDAREVVERAYEVNEVDASDDNGAPDIHAINELQGLLSGWSAKHLAHWSFPTGERLDISDLIAARRREVSS
jgi:hypothetical protein